MALVLAAATGAGLVTLGGIAWVASPTVAATRSVQVQQRAELTYDARARRSAAYPTGQVRTGDPVFLQLVPTMDVQIGYRATLGTGPSTGSSGSTGPSGSAGLRGTRRVTAELRSSNGWHRGFELLPRAEFTGGGFDAVAPLDLKHVRALVAGLEKATGISNGRFTLSVRSEIALNGVIPGHRTPAVLRDSFFPELTFSYDAKQLQLAGVSGPVTEVVRGRTSAVLVPSTAPNRLRVLGLNLPIGPLRTGGLAAGLLLLAVAGLIEQARRKARRNPPDRMVRRIVLADTASSSTKSSSTKPTSLRSTTSASSTRPRVPGPRTAALAERQSARTHPSGRGRDRD